MPSEKTTALVLVDVLNGFFHPEGAMWYQGVETVVPALQRLLDAARTSGTLVVHVADRHRPDVIDREFAVVPEHLPRGGFDAEFYAGFAPRAGEPVVEKRRYSAFFATDLALVLHEHDVTSLVIAGVKTNVCIRATATDAFAHGFGVIVPREATNSNRPHLEEASIEDVARYIGRVVPIDEAVALL